MRALVGRLRAWAARRRVIVVSYDCDLRIAVGRLAAASDDQIAFVRAIAGYPSLEELALDFEAELLKAP